MSIYIYLSMLIYIYTYLYLYLYTNRVVLRGIICLREGRNPPEVIYM